MNMGGPSWLPGIFAAIMIVVAVYCAARLVLGPILHRRIDVDVDAVHVVMGVTMAGMLAPRINPFAGRLWTDGWAGFLALATVYFLVRGIPGALHPDRLATAPSHYVPHAVHSGAMVYMFLALPVVAAGAAAGPMPMSGAPMPGMGAGAAAGPAAAPTASTTAAYPTLALVLGLFMAGYAVLLINRVTTATSSAVPVTTPAPLLTASTPSHTATRTAPGPDQHAATDTPVGSRQSPLAPQVATCYKIAMSITMAYMLVTML
jgi:hypothetical protein